METNVKNHAFAIVFFLLLLILCLFIDYSFMGQDGTSLWLPILGDFTRGNYETGGTIFGGQNLLALYGKLPLWTFLKELGHGPYAIVNTSLWFFLVATYVFTSEIFKGLSGKEDRYSNFLILLYVLLSPIITNRIYTGHFNLLYGMLPMLVALCLIYNRSKWILGLSVLSLWTTLSTPSYQILSYYILYLPVLVLWFRLEARTPLKNYLIALGGVFVLAFLSNLDVFLALLAHSKNPENLRSQIENMVYTYTVTKFTDIGSFFFSSYGFMTASRDQGFFHEMNYPLGIFFLVAFGKTYPQRKIIWSLIAVFVIGVLFSANIPVFNLLAELPIIKLFRVPQRVLMIPAFLIPLLALSVYSEYINLKSFFAVLFLIIVANLLPTELFLVVGLIISILCYRFPLAKNALLAFSLALLFSGLDLRLRLIQESNLSFSRFERYVLSLDEMYKLSEGSKVIHFESPVRSSLTTAANYIGIRTVEGYGHPPKKIFDTIKKYQPMMAPSHGNSIFYVNDGKTFKNLHDELGITDLVYVDQFGAQKHEKLK